MNLCQGCYRRRLHSRVQLLLLLVKVAEAKLLLVFILARYDDVTSRGVEGCATECGDLKCIEVCFFPYKTTWQSALLCCRTKMMLFIISCVVSVCMYLCA